MSYRGSVWVHVKTGAKAELYYHKTRTGRCALRSHTRAVVWRGFIDVLRRSPTWKRVL